MAGGYDTTPTDPLDVLRSQLVDLKARVSELERPSGTQLYESLRNPVYPLVGANYASGFAGTTSYVTRASFSLTVPDGYTQALIYASGFTNMATARSDGSDGYYAKINIAGVDGVASTAIIIGTFTGAVSAFMTSTLTGLSPGSSISVSLLTKLFYGPGDPSFTVASVTAQALFLR